MLGLLSRFEVRDKLVLYIVREAVKSTEFILVYVRPLLSVAGIP